MKKRIDLSLILINIIILIATILNLTDPFGLKYLYSSDNTRESIHFSDLFLLYIFIILFYYRIKPSYNGIEVFLSKIREEMPVSVLLILIWLSSDLIYYETLDKLLGKKPVYETIYHLILLILSLLLFFEIGYSYFKSKKANSMEK